MSALLAFLSGLLKALFGWIVESNSATAQDAGAPTDLKDSLNAELDSLPPTPDDPDSVR